MGQSNKVESAKALLCEKAALLGRLPTRADCTVDEVVFIKAYLGPWPRALESAGLKPLSPRVERLKRSRKRKMAGKRRKAAQMECGTGPGGSPKTERNI